MKAFGRARIASAHEHGSAFARRRRRASAAGARTRHGARALASRRGLPGAAHLGDRARRPARRRLERPAARRQQRIQSARRTPSSRKAGQRHADHRRAADRRARADPLTLVVAGSTGPRARRAIGRPRRISQRAHRRDPPLPARATARERYYGLGDKTGPLDLHGRRLRTLALDSLGYDPQHGDPLYKHWPFVLTRARRRPLVRASTTTRCPRAPSTSAASTTTTTASTATSRSTMATSTTT